MAYTRKMAGAVPVLKQDLVFDATPTAGSDNAVTSGGVAEAVGNISDVIPEGASAENKLVDEFGLDAKLAELELAILSNNNPAAKTLRFSFSKKDYDPTVAGVGSSGTWKKVSKYAENNVWDWTRSGTSFFESFKNAFADSDNLVSVIAAGDTSAITTMGSLFNGCASLTRVPLLDTSAVTSMQSMFNGCASLTRVPLLDTSIVTNMNTMLANCTKVEEGALALYRQASTQATPPSSHLSTFINCGKDTTTGAAELAQIPASWGGTGT